MTSGIATEVFHSADGTRLNGFRAAASEPRAALFLCHGLGEHCRRYDHVVAALNARGVSVYACDLRGHGRSGGPRGHVARWQDYVDDIGALYGAAERDGLRRLPWLQFGHSMGGLVAVHVALARQQELAGLALSAPLLGIAVAVPPLKAMLGNLLSSVWPTLTLANEIDSQYISRDPQTVTDYLNDPLVHDRVSTRWFTEMNRALAAAQSRAGELKLPVWLGHGTADRLTDPAGSRRFVAALGDRAEAHFYEGLYHEIFNEREPDRARVFDDLLNWIDARLAG